MTTLYRPVLIESAEQAEALPDGTLVIDMTPGDPYAWRKSGTFFIDHIGGTCEATPTEIAGFRPTALVPIEAEEEHARNQINITHMSPSAPQQVPVLVPCPRCGLR